ncbi:MAG: hypothetical protein AB4058_16500 [Microcystaceae cyanobacterium]
MKKHVRSALTKLIILITPFYSFQALNAFPIAQSSSQEVRSFFQTGRLSSEDRLMFRKPPSGVIPPRENSRSWQFIVFKEGGVSFWMPPGVLTEDSVTLETRLGDLAFRSLSSRSDDHIFTVAYLPALTEKQLEEPEIVLEVIQERVTLEEEFELTNSRAIKIEEFPGRELTFAGETEMIRVRAYLVNQKVYIVGVRSPKNERDERQNNSFLNSLQLLPQS